MPKLSYRKDTSFGHTTHYVSLRENAFTRGVEAGVSLHWTTPHIGIHVNRAERETHLTLNFLFLSLYLTFSSLFPYKKYKGFDDDSWELSFRAFYGHFWWVLFGNDSAWDPKKRKNGSWDWRSFLLGDEQVEKVDVEEDYRSIDLHEGSYVVHIRLYDFSTYRKRWPFKKTTRRADVNQSNGGIPVPGNPESDYFIENDAIYSMSFPAKTIDDAALHVYTTILRERIKRGWMEV